MRRLGDPSALIEVTMRLTNRFRMPQAFVRAVENDDYYKGKKVDFSVTELLSSPHQNNLKRIHEDEIVEDVIDRVWALFGQVSHTLLERGAGPDDIVEERYFSEFYSDGKPYMVSGQVDLIEPIDSGHRLTDWKTTSVWNVMNGDHDDWASQLNMLRFLVDKIDFPITELQIVAIMRDWRPGEKLRKPDYPRHPIKKIKFPIWSDDEVVEFVNERISYHVNFPSDDVCSPDERWQSPLQFAVMSKNRKSAHKLCKSLKEAEFWIKKNKKGDRIEKRISEPRKCLNYCSVAQFCSYGRQFMKEVA